MMLSERRVGHIEALRIVSKLSAETCPEYRQLLTSDPEDMIEGYDVLFFSGDAKKESFKKIATNLSSKVIVICAQELCHQVSAVYRYQ